MSCFLQFSAFLLDKTTAFTTREKNGNRLAARNAIALPRRSLECGLMGVYPGAPGNSGIKKWQLQGHKQPTTMRICSIYLLFKFYCMILCCNISIYTILYCIKICNIDCEGNIYRTSHILYVGLKFNRFGRLFVYFGTHIATWGAGQTNANNAKPCGPGNDSLVIDRMSGCSVPQNLSHLMLLLLKRPARILIWFLLKIEHFSAG